MTKVTEESLETKGSIRRLLWGVLTDFVASSRLSERWSLSPNHLSFLLISYNLGTAPRFFQFRLLQDACEYRLSSYGNAHELSTEGDTRVLALDFTRMKRRGKTENLSEVLKSTETEPQWKESPLTDPFRRGTETKMEERGRAVEGIARRMYEELGAVGSDIQDLRQEPFSDSQYPEIFEQIIKRQDKFEGMLQTIINLMQEQRESKMRESAPGGPRPSQMTVGTNTTMKANDLQRFLVEGSGSAGREQGGHFQKIISAFPESGSLSQNLSAPQRSEGGSRSSKPSPAEETVSDKRNMGGNTGFLNFGDETISLESSNTNGRGKEKPPPQPPLRPKYVSTHTQVDVEGSDHSRADRTLYMTNTHFSTKSIAASKFDLRMEPGLKNLDHRVSNAGPRHAETRHQKNVNFEYSPPFQQDRFLVGRGTDGPRGGEYGGKGGSSYSDLAGVDGQSEEEGKEEERNKHRGKKGGIGEIGKVGEKGGKGFLQERRKDESGFGRMERGASASKSNEKNSLVDREAFIGMARDIKASEHNAGDNRSTFEIPRARGSYHKNDSDSEADDVKDISKKYQN